MVIESYLIDYIFDKAGFYKSEKEGLKIDYSESKLKKNDLISGFINHCNKLDFNLGIDKQHGYGLSEEMLDMTEEKTRNLLENLVERGVIKLENSSYSVTEKGYELFRQEYLIEESIDDVIEEIKKLHENI